METKKYKVTVEVIKEYELEDIEADSPDEAMEIALQEFEMGVEFVTHKSVVEMYEESTVWQKYNERTGGFD